MKWNRSFNKWISKYLNRNSLNNIHTITTKTKTHFVDRLRALRHFWNKQKKQLIHTDSVYKLFAFYWAIFKVNQFLWCSNINRMGTMICIKIETHTVSMVCASDLASNEAVTIWTCHNSCAELNSCFLLSCVFFRVHFEEEPTT